jgi:transitional endoplasmic reticulum ATPase
MYASNTGIRTGAIDERAMRAIGAAAGDIVEVQGGKKALARVMSLRQSDSDKGMARMDELTMNEAGVEAGGAIVIRRVFNIPPAEKVILIPLHPMPALDDQYLADELAGVPVTMDSKITVRLYSENLHFVVAGVCPAKQSYDRPPTAIVTENTGIVLRPRQQAEKY